jgi:small subunit ribosomal protein S17
MANTKTTKKTAAKAVSKPVVKPEVNAVSKTDSKKVYKKRMTGNVVSAKMQNTVVVAIERKVAHKLYEKLIRVTKRIKADTNGIEVKEGETVVIEQTKPMSKGKFFKVIRKEGAK